MTEDKAHSQPQSRVEQKERTRRAILDAALRLSEETGLGGLSLRQVAKEVGIVPTAFYRHFASIDELGLALVDQSFASLREMLRDVRRTSAELRGVIEGSVAVLVEHVHQRREHFRFIARERTSGPPVVREAIRHELELFERELATDLARLPNTQAWSGDDLRIMPITDSIRSTFTPGVSRGTSTIVCRACRSASGSVRPMVGGCAPAWRRRICVAH